MFRTAAMLLTLPLSFGALADTGRATTDDNPDLAIELLSNNTYTSKLGSPRVELSMRVLNRSVTPLKLSRCEARGIDDKQFSYFDSAGLGLSIPAGSDVAASMTLAANNSNRAVDRTPGQMVEFNLQCTYTVVRSNRLTESRTGHFRLLPATAGASGRSAGNAVLSGIGSVLGNPNASKDQRTRAMVSGALDVLGAVMNGSTSDTNTQGAGE